jgi:Protein of unknown function (DUF2934)
MPSTDPVSRPAGLEEQIRCRAYQLYEERGKTDGQELEDWLLAEAEIMSHQVRRKAS